MSCVSNTKESFEKFKSSVEILDSPLSAHNDKVFLPRGGIYMKTKAFPIQFGIPPETIKDHFSL